MLLLHQTGSVRIGEVMRYTVTYTPSQDLMLPSPERLHLRIRNTSAIAMRAAFARGPYTLCVAAYPATFDPNERFARARTYGAPEFEPMLKAGGTWACELLVPPELRETAGAGVAGTNSPAALHNDDDDSPGSVSWIVEISSQILFSTSASVGFDFQIARDEKSLGSTSYALPIVGSMIGPQQQQPQQQQQQQQQQAGRLEDHQQSAGAREGRQAAQPEGVFSPAIRLKTEDTATLWNKPSLPGFDDAGARVNKDGIKGHKGGADQPVESVTAPKSQDFGDSDSTQTPHKKKKRRKKKKVHLVMLSHGLHSNLGADMLFMKESIDKAAKQARIDSRIRRVAERERERARNQETIRQSPPNPPPPASLLQEDDSKPAVLTESPKPLDDDPLDASDDSDEEVVVRGFSGNATKTEKGIKFLGKRLARHVLSVTYPDQPFVVDSEHGRHKGQSPKSAPKPNDLSESPASQGPSSAGTPAHKDSTIVRGTSDPPAKPTPSRPYRITSISFIGHSLGGLIQTYAVAYIQKHSPEFFDRIRPINFVALASPFLGLSNENPLYVKFALDFGLVGRTGQDLGLTWRAPNLARGGWSALVSGFGEAAQKRVFGESPPESKPLLRILPTGPAHTALKKFRNRTVYSNVVNDGIVPLRTSCLLFLDWQGLGKVEKARREVGLVETVVGFGWAEITGTSIGGNTRRRTIPEEDQQQRRPPMLLLGPGDDDDDDDDDVDDGDDDHKDATSDSHQVPQPPTDATDQDDKQSLRALSLIGSSRVETAGTGTGTGTTKGTNDWNSPAITTATTLTTPFSGFFSLFRSADQPKPPPARSEKTQKIFKRSQTLKPEDSWDKDAGTSSSSSSGPAHDPPLSRVSAGHGLEEHSEAPPKTSFFESARDLLNPTLPSTEYLIDPSRRPRTIFHDRVYHPADIPPPPLKKRSTSSGVTIRGRRRSGARLEEVPTGTSSTGTSSTGTSTSSNTTSSTRPPTARAVSSASSTQDYDDVAHHHDRQADEVVDSSGMRVEEKIARAYHRDLSWRKVLVKVEPDAHNNIIVRRMFANAFGWPIMKHLADNHFGDSAAARTPDDAESGHEHARPDDQPPDARGGETDDAGVPSGEKKARGGGIGSPDGGLEVPDLTSAMHRTPSETLEAEDSVPELRALDGQNGEVTSAPTTSTSTSTSTSTAVPHNPLPRLDSATWSERDWADSEVDSDDETGFDGGGGGGGEEAPARMADGSMRSAEGAETGASSDGQGLVTAGWGWAERIVGRARSGGGGNTTTERPQSRSSSKGRAEGTAAGSKSRSGSRSRSLQRSLSRLSRRSRSRPGEGEAV